MDENLPVLVAALYRFAPIAEPQDLRDALKTLCTRLDLRGTLLVAEEGVNGTVAGADAAIADLIAALRAVEGLDDVEVKFSRAQTQPFHRMKVRLKREIVTMGVDRIDARHGVGTYVEPKDWNDLISRPEVLVIDARNDYEVAIGTFEGAVDPGTRSFTEMPGWVAANEASLKGRPVAMFCTGGIRCEKATAYLRAQGFDEVYHLKGGILRYLEDVPAQDSLWQGECFVFDERVAVTHGLEAGSAVLCRACRRPLTQQDRLSPHYREGVSCHHCHEERSEADRQRYGERHRQVRLAAERGAKRHIGG